MIFGIIAIGGMVLFYAVMMIVCGYIAYKIIKLSMEDNGNSDNE